MNEATHVPQLQDDLSIRLVHRLGHWLPGFDLFRRPDARRRWPARAFLRNTRGFSDDEAGTCTLGIIACLERGNRDMHPDAASTRERRHDNAVLCVDGAKFYRIEKTGN